MADFSFPKELRLLSAAEYQPVFNKTQYKVSCRYLLVLAKRNEKNQSRLGLVIAKKNIVKAVQRNRVKRVIRESFRLNQDLLQQLDIVILSRPGLGNLDNKVIDKKISRLWQDLVNKTRTSTDT